MPLCMALFDFSISFIFLSVNILSVYFAIANQRVLSQNSTIRIQQNYTFRGVCRRAEFLDAENPKHCKEKKHRAASKKPRGGQMYKLYNYKRLRFLLLFRVHNTKKYFLLRSKQVCDKIFYNARKRFSVCFITQGKSNIRQYPTVTTRSYRRQLLYSRPS